MKKRKIIGMLILTLMCMVVLTACGHEHIWVEADCVMAKTCSECGETEGEAVGHQWSDATCTEPETCSRCKETRGEALGHAVETWTIAQESTCTVAGVETGACSVCSKNIEIASALKEHTPGEWVVLEMPTETEPGSRIKTCVVCGEEVAKEEFTLSPEELETLYKNSCETISYKDLERTPAEYEGRQVKFTGKVVQVCSEATSKQYYSTYRVATSGSYSNVVYLCVDNYGSGVRILEDDWITFYGKYDGLFSYETVRGDTLTIPKVIAKYVD